MSERDFDTVTQEPDEAVTAEIQDMYPLSPLQQGMLFTVLFTPRTGAYIQQRLCDLRGTLNLAAFEDAWRNVSVRHPSLRTAFVWEEIDDPVQVVHQWVEVDIKWLDWRHLDGKEQEQRIESLLKTDRIKAFDLASAPLWRLTLIRRNERNHTLIWTYHHLLLDGWSATRVIGEVFAHYQAFHLGGVPDLPRPRPFRDYIAWLYQKDPSASEAFWRKNLAGFHHPTPIGMKASVQPEIKGGTQWRTAIPEPLSHRATAFVRERKLTLNTLFQAIWSLLLSRYSGENDILFGTVVSGRPADLPEVEDMTGMFINTLPLRIHIRESETAISFLERVQKAQFELRDHEHLSFVTIQGWSPIPRGTPLFESTLVFENYPLDLQDRGADPDQDLPTVENLRFEEDVNTPLSLVVMPGNEIGLRFIYDQARFPTGAIHRMADHLQQLLKGIISRPEQMMAHLDLLPKAERSEILKLGAGPAKRETQADTIHQLFEAWALKTPRAVALQLPGESVSYRQLNNRANQLASRLQALGVGSEVRVGLFFEREASLIVSILAVLKCGGTYLPMDPSYPLERLNLMAEDAAIALVLTKGNLMGRLPVTTAQILEVSEDREADELREFSQPEICPDQLAYVVYTSGSTGIPKAVMVTHRALVNYTLSAREVYRLGPDRGMLQFLSPGFDAFGEEVFPSLCSGARLVMLPNPGDQAPLQLLSESQAQGATHLHIPPVYMNQLVTELEQGNHPVPESVQMMISGGENLTHDLAQRWLNRCSGDSGYITAYGPAEATITATVFAIEKDGSTRGKVPLGKPTPHTMAVIVDRNLRLVPRGVLGELVIGGKGVARGYDNAPGHTAAKFIPNPFGPEPGGRLYRTGDLAVLLEDGNLEFMGREDHQVTLRGHRIELSEIEIVLEQQAGVRNAVVILRENEAERMLVAYAVPEDDKLPDSSALRSAIREKLPDYMVPAAFIEISEMPMLPSGKIDHKGLPKTDLETLVPKAEYVAPRTSVERLLADIWKEALAVERVGIQDDFFALGGHSLLATRIIANVQEMFNVELPLGTIFETPTIAAMAAAIPQTQAEDNEADEMEQMLRELEGLSDDEAKALLETESTPTESGRN